MREKAAAVLRVEILKEIFQDFVLDAAAVFYHREDLVTLLQERIGNR